MDEPMYYNTQKGKMFENEPSFFSFSA